jgi:hypothetical protein
MGRLGDQVRTLKDDIKESIKEGFMPLIVQEASEAYYEAELEVEDMYDSGKLKNTPVIKSQKVFTGLK